MQHLTTIRYFVLFVVLAALALLGCSELVFDGESGAEVLEVGSAVESGGAGGAAGVEPMAGQGGSTVVGDGGSACTFVVPQPTPRNYIPPAIRRSPDGGWEC